MVNIWLLCTEFPLVMFALHFLLFSPSIRFKWHVPSLQAENGIHTYKRSMYFLSSPQNILTNTQLFHEHRISFTCKKLFEQSIKAAFLETSLWKEDITTEAYIISPFVLSCIMNRYAKFYESFYLQFFVPLSLLLSSWWSCMYAFYKSSTPFLCTCHPSFTSDHLFFSTSVYACVCLAFESK